MGVKIVLLFGVDFGYIGKFKIEIFLFVFCKGIIYFRKEIFVKLCLNVCITYIYFKIV